MEPIITKSNANEVGLVRWQNKRSTFYNTFFEAETRFARAGSLEQMPTPDELYDQAIELRDRGDKEAAVSRLREAIALDDNFAIGHGMLAKLCADLALTDDAIRHAKRVVELEPNDAFSYTALSVIYQRCGRIPEAEEAKARAYYKQMGME